MMEQLTTAKLREKSPMMSYFDKVGLGISRSHFPNSFLEAAMGIGLGFI